VKIAAIDVVAVGLSGLPESKLVAQKTLTASASSFMIDRARVPAGEPGELVLDKPSVPSGSIDY
jgi:hypothetical protein